MCGSGRGVLATGKLGSELSSGNRSSPSPCLPSRWGRKFLVPSARPRKSRAPFIYSSPPGHLSRMTSHTQTSLLPRADTPVRPVPWNFKRESGSTPTRPRTPKAQTALPGLWSLGRERWPPRGALPPLRFAGEFCGGFFLSFFFFLNITTKAFDLLDFFYFLYSFVSSFLVSLLALLPSSLTSPFPFLFVRFFFLTLCLCLSFLCPFLYLPLLFWSRLCL